MPHAKDAALIGSVILLDPATGNPIGPSGTLGRQTAALSESVVLASDHANVPVTGTVAATQSGSWAVNSTPALSAGSTQVISMSRQASVLATGISIKSSAGRVHYFDVYNPNAGVVFLHFYNTASASVVAGTTTPVWSVPILPNSQRSDWLPNSFSFGTAISITATTTATGGTAPATGIFAGIGYI